MPWGGCDPGLAPSSAAAVEGERIAENELREQIERIDEFGLGKTITPHDNPLNPFQKSVISFTAGAAAVGHGFVPG